MTYEFGEVVLVPFPFTNQAAQKKRPAAVISSLDYNAARPDLIVIAVTSQVREPLLFGEIAIADWQTAGLLKVSVIKPVITTIQNDLIIQRLGRLALPDSQSLQHLLTLLLNP